MKQRALPLSTVVAVLVAVPVASAGQGIGIAGRAGTLGLGPELAIGLSERVVLRGGLGLWPGDPSATFHDVEVDLQLPSLYNVGLDVYLNAAFRLGGGVLFKSEDAQVLGVFTQDQDIGGRTFTPQELGTLTGVLDSKSRAAYFLIGFGNHTVPGVGLSIDLGFAAMGEPDVRLDAAGGSFPDQVELRSRLDAEAADFEANMKRYLEIWPIVSLGLRIGVD